VDTSQVRGKRKCHIFLKTHRAGRGVSLRLVAPHVSLLGTVPHSRPSGASAFRRHRPRPPLVLPLLSLSCRVGTTGEVECACFNSLRRDSRSWSDASPVAVSTRPRTHPIKIKMELQSS